jgi:pimeloyl-ACP methyl ester carboxylesterase
MRYVYLHGFASGPQSRKALAFRNACKERGLELEVPDLAAGAFERLTIRGQLGVLEDLLNGDAAQLIGSSMGGYLAALYAAGHPEVDRLALLAPAFDFSARWRQITGPERLANWRESGWLDVYHYGEGAMRRVHYGLFEDSLKYPGNPDFRQPARIFHGVLDTVAPVELSRRFAAAHRNAALTELDSDHELLNVLEPIIEAAMPFLTPEQTNQF